MRIVIAAPVDLGLLAPLLSGRKPVSRGYSFPPSSWYALELLERGHEVCIVSHSGDSRDWGEFSGERLRIVICRNRVHLRWLDFFRSERRQIADAIRSFSPDIVHAWWTYEFAMGALASGYPTLVSVHDWAPAILRRVPPFHYRFFRLLMQMFVLRRADHLTSVSPYIKEKVDRIARNDSVLIPNFIAIEPAVSGRRHSGTFVVGALNIGFSPRKNVQTLLKAFLLLRETVPIAELRLAGPDYETSGPAAQWAISHQLDRGVVFLGALDPNDVRRFMTDLDVFAHPSVEESFGVVVLQAMAEGVAVVGGASSGAVPWLLGHGQAGLLVDIESPSDVAVALASLATDPQSRGELGLAGRARAAATFSLPRVTDEYLDAYSRVVGGS